MTLNASGNLSLGNTNDSYKLDVRGPDGSVGTIRWANAGGRKSGFLYSDSQGVAIYDTNLNDAGIYLAGNTQMDFRVNGSQRMLINSSGNVGIGTNNPSTKFVVSNSGAGGIEMQGNSSVSGGAFLQTYNRSTNAFFDFDIVCDNMIFRTGQSYNPAMRITSGGQISQTTSIADWSHVITNASTTSPNGIIIQYTAANKNNTSNPFLYCTDNSGTTLRFEVRSNGGIANYQANDVNLSDIRTKKDITPLGSYWDKFKAIEMVKFKYKDQTHDDFNIGVIAQQLEKVAPEFVDVDGWGDTPKDGVPLKSIYTADLHHATIKVLQEAMAKIEDLQNQLDTLKNK
jgi:hypothetical protein